MSDFAKALENAQKKPEDWTQGVMPPNLFNAGYSAEDFVKEVDSTEEPESIPGAIKYEMEYHCKRLVIGQITTGWSEQGEMKEDQDDSKELVQIMNTILAGKALLLKKLENVLKDGTVIVWIEWGTNSSSGAPTPPNKNALTIDELMRPSLNPDEL